MLYKSYKIRLEPNNKQLTALKGHAGVSRHAYNQGLNYCNELYDKNINTPTAIDLHKWLVATIKKEYTWYYDYSKCSPQQSLRDLESAFKNFHRIQKKSKYTLKDSKGKLKGLPKFKKKGIRDSFYLEGNIFINGKKIKLPKIGWIRLSENVSVNSIKNCTISRISDDWYISFKTEHLKENTIKKHSVVGVDLGLKTLATLSNGEVIENVRAYKKSKNKLRRLQKTVSRRFVKGAKSQSKNYNKSKIELSKCHKRISDIRKDVLHKTTSYLSKNFDTVVIEDLNVKGMSKNHRLASSILDGGFYEFKRQLMYKKEWYGGSVIVANRFYASSKTCSRCGNVKESLLLSERVYCCDNCGLQIDRDLNASINLEKLAVSYTVTAFGVGSSVEQSIQSNDELGIKHQMFTFV